MMLKRYAFTVQHEIIVYGYDEGAARQIAEKAYANVTCISVRELPPAEVEALQATLIDNRTAPGQ
jgi:hypothetical protein